VSQLVISISEPNVMASLPKPSLAYEDESDDSIDLKAISELKAQLKSLEQQSAKKSHAVASYNALERRFNKREKLPTHICGDLLPYRYSSAPKCNLGKDIVTIWVFVYLAKYLTKRQIEALASHERILERAKSLLGNEMDFPSSWFECYMRWKGSNQTLAQEFFLGQADVTHR
jgi:hypothetical protein